MSRPSLYTFEPLSTSESLSAQLQRIVRSQRDSGAVFYRATIVNARHEPAAPDEDPSGIWIEGWLEVPAEQDPFDPPLTLAHSAQEAGEG